jgi:type II secretory pathway component PulF
MLIIAAVYTGLIALMIAGGGGKDKTADQMRKSILKGLPRFCNQLFLMMNAGLILSDAFDTISAGCGTGRNAGAFERDLAELREATDGHRISTAQVINEYAVKHDVKEMIRIAAILTENEKRGSDVVESLERESRYLWEERKTVARECGKAIDTRMSYPLGLLLIVLIVITMAPALMNI